MLKHVSTAAFVEAVIITTTLYYFVVAALFYRTEIKRLLTSKLIRLRDPPGKGDQTSVT